MERVDMSTPGVYVGESSRSIYERAKEHAYDEKAMKIDSHRIKHWMESHHDREEAPPFKFRIVGKFKDCMTRQIME